MRSSLNNTTKNTNAENNGERFDKYRKDCHFVFFNLTHTNRVRNMCKVKVNIRNHLEKMNKIRYKAI